MFSERYGVNIVNNRIIFLISVLTLLIGFNCGFDRGKTEDDDTTKSQKTETSKFVPDSATIAANIPDTLPEEYVDDWIEIQQTLSEAIERIKYKDKTALYDLELNYLYDEYTYDEYIQHGWVKAAEADTIESITVTQIQFFNMDSARVSDKVVFDGPIMGRNETTNTYMMYYQRDRWLRPTVSRMARQLLLDSAKAAENQ